MASKKINTLTNIVMSCVVYVVTIALALLLKPEEVTALYWVNMGYLVILETIFFGWLLWARTDSKEVTSMLLVIMGTYAAYYVSAGLVCIVVSALLSLVITVSVKWYVAALIVLTVLWLVPASLIAQVDSNHAERQEQVADKRAELLRQSEEKRRAKLNQNRS